MGLYVKESWRKKGVGAILIKAIEKKAFELGESCLYLYTPDSEHFYIKLGWSVMERENYNNVAVTIMKKELVF